MLPILLTALCLFVFLPLFYGTKKSHPALSLLFKGLCTCCALGVGILSALPVGGYAWMGVAALGLCVAADVLLGIHFLTGMAVFMAGHGCYMLSFLHRSALCWGHGIAFVVLLGITCFLLYRWRKLLKGKLLPFGAYALVLCCMGSCGVMCALGGSLMGMLTALGALLFIVSDAMVCRGVIAPITKRFDITAMVIYECAQLLLGFSCV